MSPSAEPIIAENDAPSPYPSVRQLRLPRFPIRATYGLIAINVMFFLVNLLSGEDVTRYGALAPVLVVTYRQWWRLVTAGFLHADVIHIAVNLYALYGLGSLMERFFGLKRFLVVYGFSLVGASVLVTLLSDFLRPTVGASGAIMGVLGALVVFYWQYRDLLLGGRGYLRQLGRMALVNIGIGLLPGISLWGHLGGFVLGAAAGAILLPRYANPDWVTARLEMRDIRWSSWLKIWLLALGESALLALALLWRAPG
ncbi:MAG: rhomboid family intramembrane serine protease [Anaerolineae bacterium]